MSASPCSRSRTCRCVDSERCGPVAGKSTRLFFAHRAVCATRGVRPGRPHSPSPFPLLPLRPLLPLFRRPTLDSLRRADLGDVQEGRGVVLDRCACTRVERRRACGVFAARGRRRLNRSRAAPCCGRETVGGRGGAGGWENGEGTEKERRGAGGPERPVLEANGPIFRLDKGRAWIGGVEGGMGGEWGDVRIGIVTLCGG